jgi:hypothetical protein
VFYTNKPLAITIDPTVALLLADSNIPLTPSAVVVDKPDSELICAETYNLRKRGLFGTAGDNHLVKDRK